MEHFDPFQAYGVVFGDMKLARCVRETAKINIEHIDKLSCFQADIRYLQGIESIRNLLELDLYFN